MRFIWKGIKIQVKKKKATTSYISVIFQKGAATILMGIKILF